VNVCSPGEIASQAKSAKKGFPRGARLLRHADFQRVYKTGKRHFTAHMTVFYLPRAEGSGLRVGFTVGRVLGGAVERNRIKRRLREAVRKHRVGVTAGADVVINPKKSLLTVQFQDLAQEVAGAFVLIQHKLGAGVSASSAAQNGDSR
jgi:ribonuclease P protein component